MRIHEIKRRILYRFRKMRGIMKVNTFSYTQRRQKNLCIFQYKFHWEKKSSLQILQKRVNNGGIFPRVTSTNGEVGSRGRRPPAERPISINNLFFQHEVGFIQPPLSGESQLRNPRKKRPHRCRAGFGSPR